MKNLLNQLLWTGFKWKSFREDTSYDYISQWKMSYGFYLSSLDVVVTTDEYMNLKYKEEELPYKEDIFTSDATIYYAYSSKLDFEIRTSKFDIFIRLLNSYVTLRRTECYPLISNAPKIVNAYFTLIELDQDKTQIEVNKFITNSQKNLDILVNYCESKQDLETISYKMKEESNIL